MNAFGSSPASRGEVVVLVTGGAPWEGDFSASAAAKYPELMQRLEFTAPRLHNPSGAAAIACDGAEFDVATPAGRRHVRVVGRGDVPAVWHDDADELDPGTASGAVRRILREVQPDGYLQLGAGRIGPWFKVEETARNLNCAMGLADARGIIRDPDLQPGTPGFYPRYHHGDELVALPSTLPIDDVLAAMTEAGGTCVRSKRAGAFVCEDLFFDVMLQVNRGVLPHPLLAAGLVHTPRVSEPGPLQELVNRCAAAAIRAIAVHVAALLESRARVLAR